MNAYAGLKIDTTPEYRPTDREYLVVQMKGNWPECSKLIDHIQKICEEEGWVIE